MQLDFLLESEAVLWSNYQHGYSITVQTSSTADIRASQLEHKCTVPEFPSRVNDRQNIRCPPHSITQINSSCNSHAAKIKSTLNLLPLLQKRDSVTATVHPKMTTKSSRMMQQRSVIKVIEIMRRPLLLSAGSLKMAAYEE